jgi:hypothetical protein
MPASKPLLPNQNSAERLQNLMLIREIGFFRKYLLPFS